MPHKPVEPAPDTINPRSPPEAPRVDWPAEQPPPCTPEYVCPPDPSYIPDEATPEQPALDPDS